VSGCRSCNLKRNFCGCDHAAAQYLRQNRKSWMPIWLSKPKEKIVTKFLFSAAALVAAFATPAIAADQPTGHRFTRDGETYFYTAVAKANRVVLSGRSFPSGSQFHLVVQGNRINGDADGVPVDFKVPNAQAMITPMAVVAR
jgi:hypothetical protein